MFLKLNRYSKKSKEYYPWIVNTNCIETVNSTSNGTIIMVSSSTEPQEVLENVEQIGAIMNGEPYRAFPDWIPSAIRPEDDGEYLCKIWVTPMKITRYGNKQIDMKKSSYETRCVRKYKRGKWDLVNNDELDEQLRWCRV